MKKITLEHIVELGDKIHNADEIICLTHHLDKKTEEHDLHFAMIGEKDMLAHLIAKRCCMNEEFFKVIVLAIHKLNLTDEQLKIIFFKEL